jgi:hypothetical protein
MCCTYVGEHFLPAPILACVIGGSRRSSETKNWSPKLFGDGGGFASFGASG